MEWIFLFAAGVLEVAWSGGLKQLTNVPSTALAFATAITCMLSLVFLWAALQTLPLAIAYPIWTSFGAIGTVALSTLIFHQKLEPLNVIGIVMILIGVVLVSYKTHG